MDLQSLYDLINNLKANIRDGATWANIAQSILTIIRNASTLIKKVDEMSDAEKQQFCVEWALRGYDAAVAAITAHFATWWLIPVFSIVRVVVVRALPGIVDWVYRETVKRLPPADDNLTLAS